MFLKLAILGATLLAAVHAQHRYVLVSGGQTAPGAGSGPNANFAPAQAYVGFSDSLSSSVLKFNPTCDAYGGSPQVLMQAPDVPVRYVYSVSGYLHPSKRICTFNPANNITATHLGEPTARAMHIVVALSKTKLISCGGNLFETQSSDTCDIFDVPGNQWTQAANMKIAVAGATASSDYALSSGKVFVFGGSTWCASTNPYDLPCTAFTDEMIDAVQIYDSASNTWTLSAAPGKISKALPERWVPFVLAASAPVPSSSTTASAAISICGGYDKYNTVRDSCWIYNIGSDTLVHAGALSLARMAFAMVSEFNGETGASVHIVLGGSTSPTPSNTTVTSCVESFQVAPPGALSDEWSFERVSKNDNFAGTDCFPTGLKIPVCLHHAVSIH